jgi:4-amino-4-deoxy-L-arabinose transferase-like glycosyltransferase
MNTNPRRTAVLGIFLIALGFIWWMNLWWLLLPAALVAGGVIGYLQRRAAGRMDEALHSALWGVGLGILFLAQFVWPGILFLAGGSILLRGREAQIQTFVEQQAARARGRIRPSRPAERVPVETVPSSAVPIQAVPIGDTTRLHD